jgi:hypothetical protein
VNTGLVNTGLVNTGLANTGLVDTGLVDRLVSTWSAAAMKVAKLSEWRSGSLLVMVAGLLNAGRGSASTGPCGARESAGL